MIDTKGNFRTAELPELKYYLNQNQNKFVTVQYRAYKHETSKALTGYYHYFLVPVFVRLYKNTGLWLLPTEAEQKMREAIPIMTTERYDIEKDRWFSRLMEFKELDDPDKVLYIQFLKMHAAEDFNYSINDQLTWKDKLRKLSEKDGK